MTILQPFQSYHIGSELTLSKDQKVRLISCFQESARSVVSPLGGRNAVSMIDFLGVGRVVVKNYMRGGFIRHFNKRTYLKVFKIRSRSEYNLLKKLNAIGVNVPDPVAFAFKGRFFYRAWIVTQEIPHAQTLAELSVKDPEKAKNAMIDLNRQVNILIQRHIHHVDLHPGNVLVDSFGKVYLIDFDKARTGLISAGLLEKKYIQRWRRAVDKHHLPEIIRNLLENNAVL